MFLLVLACLIGTDDCRVLPIAGGFEHERQCLGYHLLMIDGWKAEHPQATVKRWMCTDKPEAVIGAWMT